MTAISMTDDIDRIMDVMASAFDPQFGEAWSRAQVLSGLVMPNAHYHLLAPTGHTPLPHEPTAGFALLRSVLDEQELLLIAVNPQYRRLGLGAKLLSQALENARSRGIAKMFLEMRAGNPAEYLYLAHGFTPTATRPNYYRTASGARLDAITYVCLLDN
ncbi:MAG: hypothetical protein RLY97_1596 [Pseudomonadota bacterium]|jgi:ribosomal-protein-alanine N-acetyltransferase